MHRTWAAKGVSTPPPTGTGDVVLSDGGTVRLRPISPADGRAPWPASTGAVRGRHLPPVLRAKPALSEADIAHLTTVDHVDRVALVAELGDELLAVARYERLPQPPTDAEVAFVVGDPHQGRGIGTVLLEHLAAAARDRGITRFVAETLADNGRMLGVFRHAGFDEAPRWATASSGWR